MSPSQSASFWASFLKSFNSLLSLRLMSWYEITSFISFSALVLILLARDCHWRCNICAAEKPHWDVKLIKIGAGWPAAQRHWLPTAKPTLLTPKNPGLVEYNLRAQPLLYAAYFSKVLSGWKFANRLVHSGSMVLGTLCAGAHPLCLLKHTRKNAPKYNKYT